MQSSTLGENIMSMLWPQAPSARKTTPLIAAAVVLGLAAVGQIAYRALHPPAYVKSPVAAVTAVVSPVSATASAPPPAPVLVEMLACQHLLVMYSGAKQAPATITRTKEQARTRASQAVAEIKSGESFESVVRNFSDEPGAGARNGELGSFPRGTLVPELETALLTVPIGKTTDVVESRFGFHVIRRSAPTRDITAEECTNRNGELFTRNDSKSGNGHTECRAKKASTDDALPSPAAPLIP
jgi:PPIC-type peptidyl-prolyl cis-trans isomerase-like protein